MKIILSLGAGVQSTTLLLMSIKGELPPIDAWIFADTMYEPKAVYTHLEWLKEISAKAGIAFYVVSVGNLRKDAIDFRQMRKSSDGKRFASIPFFMLNPDGTLGKLKRQCTKEYKVIPIERTIKREILGLVHKQRAPKEIVIEQWMGISSDEHTRAKAPGRWSTHKRTIKNLFNEDQEIDSLKKWNGIQWKTHTYPLLNLRMKGDRTNDYLDYLKYEMSRTDCIDWLKKAYPGRTVPKSACLCCPFRDNANWRDMRDNHPEEWADAVAFDREIREIDDSWYHTRIRLASKPFLHRQLVPLDQVNLDGEGEPEGLGCGVVGDEFSIGYCGR